MLLGKNILTKSNNFFMMEIFRLQFFSGSVIRRLLEGPMREVLFFSAVLIFSVVLGGGIVFAQEGSDQLTVTGVVTDVSGEPLVGATVLERGTTIGTQTDFDGNFALVGVSGLDAVLVFSYVGFETQEVELGGRDVVDVILEEDAELEEVVVIGYGTKRRIAVTGAIGTIETDQLEEIPAATVGQLLAGRASGLFITQSGGKPGKTSTIRIRAASTFSSSNATPLFVIDGVVSGQFAFEGLDVSEIDNISILKDGASAAIYGSRAANGVIIVTTKRGQAGKPVINITATHGYEEPTVVPETLDAYQSASIINKRLELQEQRQAGFVASNDSKYYTPDELDYFRENSWDLIDQTYRNPLTTRVSLNVGGGSERVNYFVGGSFFNGTGTFDNLSFQRYNLRARVDANISDHLSASLNLSTDNRVDKKPYWRWDGDNDDFTDLYRNMLYRGKFHPLYTSEGLPIGNVLSWHPGEVLAGNAGYNHKNWINYNTILSLDYRVPFVDGLSLRGLFNQRISNDFRKLMAIPYDMVQVKRTGANNHIFTDEVDPNLPNKVRSDGDQLQQSYGRGISYQFNFFVNYVKEFGDHALDAKFIYEQAESRGDSFNATRRFVITPEVDQFFGTSNDSEDSFVGGGGSENGRLSYVGSVSYSYGNEVFVDASLRVDGSVNFPVEGRYGYFPALAVAWRLNEAEFFESRFGFFDNFKLTASFAETGSDAVGGISLWQQNYGFTTGSIFGGGLTNGIFLGGLPSSALTWETERSFNYGLDVALLDNKLTSEVNVFHTRRSDILGFRQASLPTTFGQRAPRENYGVVTTFGYEVDVGYRETLENGFSYGANLSYGYSTNKVVEYDQAVGVRDHLNRVGHSLDRIQGNWKIFGFTGNHILRTQAEVDALPEGYTINGLKPEVGMLNFRDLRGPELDEPDGKIDGNDRIFLANRHTAPIAYGLNLSASWKGWSVSAFLQGLAGHYTMPAFRWAIHSQEATGFADHLDYYDPVTNPDGRFPDPYQDRRQLWSSVNQTSSLWLMKADFIRLKNVNVGYDVPARVKSRLGVSNLRFYFNGTNLLLLQSKVFNFDPEGNNNAYPLSRSYTFGINLSI